MSIDFDRLYQEILNHYGNPQPNRRGWIDVDCPFCGAPADKQSPRFSFNKLGWHCFSQGTGGSLVQLAEILRVALPKDAYGSNTTRHATTPRSAPAEKPPPLWIDQAETLINAYENHNNKVEIWQTYKPVAEETIKQHRFGVGILPGHTTRRLIVPLVWRGKVVGLKGRLIPPYTPGPGVIPWIAAGGSNVSTLWNYDNTAKGQEMVWICENYVDAAMVTHELGMPCLATGGVRQFVAQELEALRELNAGCIVLAFDNDLAGQAQPELREQLAEQWLAKQRAQHPDNHPKQAPRSVAFMAAEQLEAAGIRYTLFKWPSDAPPKADLAWVLSH